MSPLVLRGVGIQGLENCGQGTVVAKAAQPRDHRLGDVRDVTVMSKRFAGVYVGNVNFDAWNVDCRQGIANCHASVGKSSGVDDNELRTVSPCLMNCLDELLLTITLQTRQRGAGTLGLGLQPVIDLIEGLRAVDFRLAGAQQIEIGTV